MALNIDHLMVTVKYENHINIYSNNKLMCNEKTKNTNWQKIKEIIKENIHFL